jgi:proton-translocating NADH-quinone oxidoreductase chain L
VIGGAFNTLASSSHFVYCILCLCLGFPFFGGLIALMSPPTLKKDFITRLPFLSILFSFFCAVTLFIIVVIEKHPYEFKGPLWFDFGNLIISWSFFLDSLTSVMLLVITFISTLVIFYSLDYMSHDYNVHKFMGYLALFAFFMLLLVTAGNLPQMFFGWEGVGLLSFLLINFWNTRINANKAAIKAIVVNKIGDFFFMLAMAALVFSIGSLDITTIFAYFDNKPNNLVYNVISLYDYSNITVDFCCICLLLAAVAKSAQIPFHTWLPDAMEGPSPVSALLHAATMVTAGVFLICRFSPLFQASPVSLWLCTIIGALTAIFAATSGFFQNDIKKIVALSTCSQIGYMFFICGLSGFNLAMFHLFNHAFFKAGLFLCCGAIIHALNDEQDIRRMGALSTLLPLSTTSMIICSLSLAGFPFLTGYYSKDAILEFAYISHTNMGLFAFFLGLIAAFCTALYSSKLIYLVFITRPNASHKVLLQAHDAPYKMAIPMIILTFCSIFVGYVLRDLFIGIGTDFWGVFIPLYDNTSNLLFSEYIPTYIKVLPTVAAIGGLTLAIPLYKFSLKLNFKPLVRSIYVVFYYKWFFDHIYNTFFVKNILYLGYHVFYDILDKGILENLGPKGISKNLINISLALNKLQSGYLRHYLFTYLFGFSLMLITVAIASIGLDLSIFFDLRYLILILALSIGPAVKDF